MAALDSKVQQRLIKEWLDRLRQLKKERRPLQLVMCCVLLLPLILLVILVLHMLFVTEPNLTEGVVSTSLLGISTLCFVYLGKIQACNDDLILIEFAVFKGDEDLLNGAISRISCFGSFQGILNDVKRIAGDRTSTAPPSSN